MVARVKDSGCTSEPFSVTNGTKQGGVLAPLLLSIVFSPMLHDAFEDCPQGVMVHFCTDGSVFNLQRLKAKSGITEMLLRDILFTDDSALFSHNLEDMQFIGNSFAQSAHRYGLTISLKKTEAMLQPRPEGATYCPIHYHR